MIGLDLGFWQNHNAPSFDPLSLSPALWLDASDASTLFQSNGGAAAAADGDPVGYWLDKSGNGKHASQTDPVLKPLCKLNVKNGKSCILFDGVNDVMTHSLNLSGDSTIFIVFNKLTTALGNVMGLFGATPASTRVDNILYSRILGATQWGTYTNSNYQSSGTVAGSTFILASTVSNTPASGGAFEMRTNGSSLVSISGSRYSGDSSDRRKIGLEITGSVSHNGNIAEILAFPSALSSTNRQNVESYLNSKWAVY